jgi:hypothetical protein
LEVGSLQGWRSVLAVQEADVVRVHRGDVVRIEIPALAPINEATLSGHVISIGIASTRLGPSSSGRNVQGGSSIQSMAGPYEVIVAVDTAQLAALGVDNLRRGYTVRAKIVTQSRRGIGVVWDRLRIGRSPVR